MTCIWLYQRRMLSLVNLKLITSTNGRKTITWFWTGRSQPRARHQNTISAFCRWTTSSYSRVHQGKVAQSTRCDNKQSVIIRSTYNWRSGKLRSNRVCAANSPSARHATIYAVFQAVVEARLCYAVPARYGHTTATDRDRAEGFFRWAVTLGYRSVNSPTFDHVISIADDRQLKKVSMDHSHSLHLYYSQLSAPNSTIYVADFIMFCLSKHQSVALTLGYLLDFYIKIIVITRSDNSQLLYSTEQHLIARIALPVS